MVRRRHDAQRGSAVSADAHGAAYEAADQGEQLTAPLDQQHEELHYHGQQRAEVLALRRQEQRADALDRGAGPELALVGQNLSLRVRLGDQRARYGYQEPLRRTLPSDGLDAQRATHQQKRGWRKGSDSCNE